MAQVLLFSETIVKSVTNISDNLTPKFLRPSMIEAQEVEYKGIVGDALLAKLKEVAERRMRKESTPEDAPYIAVIDKSQYLLAYASVADVLFRVSFKIGNLGVVTTGDDNVSQASTADVGKMQTYYRSKADAFVFDLQRYLLRNQADLPELTEAQCYTIKSNLYSGASCGIFLGGARGNYPKKGGGYL